MQSDFHYCAIRTLAELAGFPSDEAQLMAYASQYTDDATEHKGIRINHVPTEVAGEIARLDMTKNGRFEPVCTAHKCSVARPVSQLVA